MKALIILEGIILFTLPFATIFYLITEYKKQKRK